MATAAIPFSRRMEAAKRHAMHQRNKGRHVGASAKGWDVARKLDRDSFHDAARVALSGFQSDCIQARHEFRLYMQYGPHWLELTTIPF